MFRLAVFSLALASLVFLGGCKKPAVREDDSKKQKAQDPWEQVGKKLKKETEFAACQNALRTLVDNLRSNDSAEKPPSLEAEEERKLATIVPLSPSDRDEIHAWNYSSHDAAYLTECFYLRDAAQSLQLPNLTPEQQADIGFAWVCRSVALHPWLVTWSVGDRKGLFPAALPPMYILRRGYGSALERMYVFLSLLQQLELDGCLIGPPGAKEITEWSGLGADKKPYPGGPSRPFWAVGVRVGQEIKLYDPWRDEAFPATLSALKNNPEASRGWFESAANLSGVKLDDVKNATVYLALPVNSLSPRMDLLNRKLAKEGVSVRLSMNPETYRSAFPDPKPTFWNPPDDRFAYGRTSRTFLPREQGGADETQPPNRLFDIYMREQLLPAVFRVALPELVDKDGQSISDASDRLFLKSSEIYASSFLEPPTPRERIQRGQFQEVIRDLIEKQSQFGKGLELLRNTRNAEEIIRNWCIVYRELFERLSRTVLIADKSEQASEAAAIRSAIDNHWRDPAVLLMINRQSIPVCNTETTYLIALCKHEVAERTQMRADYAAPEESARLKQQAIEDWISARSSWQKYFDEGNTVAQNNIPGRLEQAKKFRARAEKMAAAKP